jgi:DNA-directed RNA polymerase specialized sigma subunit
MPARKTKRSYRSEELSAQFATAPVASDAQIQIALDRYLESGADADRDAIATLYLPLITAMALNRRKRRDDSELDELISDGCAAVMNVIQRHADLPLYRFVTMMCSAIRCSFIAGSQHRQWAGAVRGKTHGLRTMSMLRKVFFRQHGRFPKSDEIRTALGQMIDNRFIENEFRKPRMIASSSLADRDGAELLAQMASAATPSPVYELMGREAIALALKPLKGVDRTMFKLAIDGVSDVEIAKRVGLGPSKVGERINGLLWEARCRADLAGYLGVVPSQTIPEKYYGNSRKVPRISKAKPAELAA